MKILLITHIFPYPLNEGGRVAQYGIIEYLTKNNDVTLVLTHNYKGLPKDVDALKKLIPSLQVNILSENKEVLQKDAIFFLLKGIEKIQWIIKKQLKVKRVKYGGILENNSFINPVRIHKTEIVKQLLEIVADIQPDIIQVDFIDNAGLVNALPTNIPKVLVHHDLRFASLKQACQLNDLDKEYTTYLTDYAKTIELAFLEKFSTVITFSEEDRKRLLQHMNTKNVLAIPFPVLDKNILSIDQPYSIDKLVFIGPDHHMPNYDAVEWYANEIAPMIWQKFKLKLVVVGKWSLDNMKFFSKKEGVEFVGFVDDLQPVIQNSIMVLPLRIGSGIRTKLLDAFAYGVPVVSTSLGAEGLGAGNGNELLIADTAEQFITSIKYLLDNPVELKALRDNANSFVRKNYSQQSVYDKRMALYKQLTNSNS
jgi:glycosyltransferase involved in cell wall biosynthesis